ncbi:MAG: response regulator transcription factor [Granulosicoccus sp.]|nr:response regulator transcription factor [Granulosicoccus sp.]
MNILVVEDESRVADFITRGLRSEGWTTEHVGNGESALSLLSEHEFDAVLLDLMLPGISGQDVCRKMRARGNLTPVLMLTALDSVSERVAGLRMGADDYLPKPFDFDELVARIEALVRRKTDFKHASATDELSYEGLRLNTKSLLVTLGDKEVILTSRERSLLMLFMNNPGKVFARERILNAVWGSQEDPLTNIIDVYIGRLRKKLGSHGKLIRTIRGHGYRFG